MKASIDITLIFLFFMIDGIGGIVVFVSNQGYRILYLKTWKKVLTMERGKR